MKLDPKNAYEGIGVVYQMERICNACGISKDENVEEVRNQTFNDWAEFYEAVLEMQTEQGIVDEPTPVDELEAICATCFGKVCQNYKEWGTVPPFGYERFEEMANAQMPRFWDVVLEKGQMDPEEVAEMKKYYANLDKRLERIKI